jgi:hypothetical protein
MNSAPLSTEQVAVLDILSRAIVPADARDQGVAGLNVGEAVARKIQVDPNRADYLEALRIAATMAQENFKMPILDLDSGSLSGLLQSLRQSSPGLFKLLRTEACAIYLSQASTWKRIGFPGPSIETGGYPEFHRVPRPET